MSEELVEALAAINGENLAPAKIPAGKTVIGVRLSRNQDGDGKYTSLVRPGWQPVGMAIAMQAGKVVMANQILGHWTKSGPKLVQCHKIACAKCGKEILMPLAVWEAKDSARRSGVQDLTGVSGWDILKRYGSCSCGGKWEQFGGETKELGDFAQEVLKDISGREKPVPQFIPPAFFTVRPVEEANNLGRMQWINDALAGSGKCALPYDPGLTGPVFMFNPGYWIGWVDDPEETGLFFGSRERESRFDLGEIDGM